MLLANLPPAAFGGAEIQAFRLCRELRKNDVELRVISWGKVWHKRNGEIDGIPFLRLRSFLGLLIDIPSLFKRKKNQQPTRIEYDDRVEKADTVRSKVWLGMIVRYHLFLIDAFFYLWLRRRRFDIIHVHTMEWPAWVAVVLGRLLNKPVLIKDSTMNGITNILRYPSGQAKQELIIRSAWFVAMTNAIKHNLLSAGVPDERIFLIPNGISIRSRPVAEKEWTNRVVFVGNLTQQPAKGIDILLKAWKLVREQVPGAMLHIIGKGRVEDYETYTEKTGIKDSVKFWGAQKNIDEHLEQADIFVLPSRREGMSNALMEAMLFGLPTVATDISGNQDLIQHGVSGLLVPTADVNALAAALEKLLKDKGLASELGKAAYIRILQECDITTVAERYLSLYHHILGRQTQQIT
jgi:glycosyltransferase involved in cell wall biosynthesis